MLFDSEDNDQILKESSNFSSFGFKSNERTEKYNSTNLESSYLKQTFQIAFRDLFNFSNLCFNQFNNFALNLKTHCIESSFEFRIFTILLINLFILVIFIFIFWKIFGNSIDHFYKYPGTYKKSLNTSNTIYSTELKSKKNV